MLLTEERQNAAMIEDIVYQFLVRCRNKGVIEAAGEVMDGLLCHRLFAQENRESVRGIPHKSVGSRS